MDHPLSKDLSADAIERLLAGDDPATANAAAVAAPPAPSTRPDDAAVVPLSFKPAIIVLLGGSGIEAGHELLRRLDQFIAEAGDSPAVRQRAESIFVHGVDTHPHPRLQALGAGNWLVLPRNPLGVNGRVQALWRANAHFRAVWPQVGGTPYLPGDFIDGAGQDRLKGRLAWLLDQFQGGSRVAPMVLASVQRIQNVLGLAPVVADGAFEIPVYLVRGLGGGTGSGLGDAVAVELRQALPAYCRLIAVELLPDAAELKTQKAEHPALRANAAAALAERERLATGNHALSPFFERDGLAGAIVADEPPFLYSYLFSRTNGQSLTMTVPGQPEAHVAGCLAAEIFLSSADQLQDPSSQFRQKLTELPGHEGRSCLYASAAVSELYYRHRLVAASLGSRFAAEAIDARLSLDAIRTSEEYVKGRSAADTFMDECRISWISRSLRVRLDAALPGDGPLPLPPALSESFPAWADARADDVPRVVAGRIRDFDAWRDRRWRPAQKRRAAALIAEFRGALAVSVDDQLGGQDGWGFARAVGFLAQLGTRLTAEYEALMVEIDGPDWRTEPGSAGLKHAVAKRRSGAAAAVRATQDRFGPFGLRGAQAKRDFEAQWWGPFAAGERELARAQAARITVSALLATRALLEQRLRELDAELRKGANELRGEATAVLGRRDLGGVLEERVLEDARLVSAAFAPEFDAARVGLSAFAQRLLTGPGGARALLQAAVAAPDPARAVREGGGALLSRAAADGAAIFLPTTEALSVWDALQRELDTRLALREIDEPLRRTLLSLRDEARVAEAPGAPPQAAPIVQRYAEQRIRICLNRAAPFWSLDDRAALEAPLLLERPIRLPLVGYDRDRYLEFCERAGLSEFLDRVVSTLGVTPKDRPGPYAVSVYVREGGVPLFYLDRALTGPMLRDAAVVGRARPLMTDARSAREIVECDPPESDEARLGFTLAAAVHFRVATLDAAGGVSFGLNGHGAPTFASVAAAWEVLGQDLGLADEIVRQVRTCFAALSDHERRQAIAAAATAAAARAEAAAQAGNHPDRIIWQRARTAAERRAERGHYHLA